MQEWNATFMGLDQLKQRLREISTKDSQRITMKALRAGAKVFQVEEQGRAPMRPDLPSGTALPPGALKTDVTIKKVSGEPILLIGPGKHTARQAHLVEMGHRMVTGGKNRLLKNGKTKGPGKVVGQVPPHPYIRPAFEAAKEPALDAMAQSMRADFARLDKRGG